MALPQDLQNFFNDQDHPYYVKQGGSYPDNPAGIQRNYRVIFSKTPSPDPNPYYTITVLDSQGKPLEPPLEFSSLEWDEYFGCLKQDGRIPGHIVQVSFYAQDPGGPDELKVLYGTIIKTDPDSVGAWSADDRGGPG